MPISYAQNYAGSYSVNIMYRISSINTASSISTAVWYYSNTNINDNIEFNVYFNSNAPSNNTE